MSDIERMRDLRGRGFTYQQIADRYGVSRQAIHKRLKRHSHTDYELILAELKIERVKLLVAIRLMEQFLAVEPSDAGEAG